jgi:DNA-binding XRE family transcriptional regulator
VTFRRQHEGEERARGIARCGIGLPCFSLHKPRTCLEEDQRRIAELRVERGWTQEAFAQAAEVSVGYVRRLEPGDENLKLSSMVRLANLLAFAPVDLLQAPRSLAARRGRPPRFRRD